VGNVTYIRDHAQQNIFFRNKRVDPSSEYTYDALYWVIEAMGRKHIGLPDRPSSRLSRDFHTRLVHPNDGKAMTRYIESYEYDQVGNFKSVRHATEDLTHPGRTRRYTYVESSQLEPRKDNNHLSSTQVGSATKRYRYDGNAGIQGLEALGWYDK